MRASLDRWSQIGASPWALRVLRFGYRIPWRRPPPPLRRKAYPQPPSDLAFGHQTADKWVSRSFVAESPPEEAAVTQDVSPTFVIYHPKDRLVVDLSAKNEFMEDRKFQYETLTGYTTQLSPGDHLFSWACRTRSSTSRWPLPTRSGLHFESATACSSPSCYRLA